MKIKYFFMINGVKKQVLNRYNAWKFASFHYSVRNNSCELIVKQILKQLNIKYVRKNN